MPERVIRLKISSDQTFNNSRKLAYVIFHFANFERLLRRKFHTLLTINLSLELFFFSPFGLFLDTR